MHTLMFEVELEHQPASVATTTYRIYEHNRLECVTSYHKDKYPRIITIGRWFFDSDGDLCVPRLLIPADMRNLVDIKLAREVQVAYRDYVNAKFEQTVLSSDQ